MRRLSKVVGATGLAALTLAGPAQADEQSFLQTLRDQGQYMPPWFDKERIGGGYWTCGQLHAGVPRAELVPQIISVDGNLFIDAAQQYLCPDTLGAGS